MTLKRYSKFSSSGPLRGGTPLQRNKPLRPRSKKTARTYVTRRKVVDLVLARDPWCRIRWDRRCQRYSVDVHEPGMRSRGADICDPEQCVGTCRHCHDMVHANPAEATARGWLIPSGPTRKGQAA